MSQAHSETLASPSPVPSTTVTNSTNTTIRARKRPRTEVEQTSNALNVEIRNRLHESTTPPSRPQPRERIHMDTANRACFERMKWHIANIALRLRLDEPAQQRIATAYSCQCQDTIEVLETAFSNQSDEIKSSATACSLVPGNPQLLQGARMGLDTANIACLDRTDWDIKNIAMMLSLNEPTQDCIAVLFQEQYSAMLELLKGEFSNNYDSEIDPPAR